MPPDSAASPDQPAGQPGLPQVVRLAAYGVIVPRGEIDGSTDGFEWVPVGEVAGRRVVDLVDRILAGLEAGG